MHISARISLISYRSYIILRTKERKYVTIIFISYTVLVEAVRFWYYNMYLSPHNIKQTGQRNFYCTQLRVFTILFIFLTTISVDVYVFYNIIYTSSSARRYELLFLGIQYVYECRTRVSRII